MKKGSKPTADIVSHPSHYAESAIEVLEALEAWNLPMHCYSAVQYVARAHKKGSEIEDLEKAVWYLARRRELLKAKQEGRKPCRPNQMPKLFK